MSVGNSINSLYELYRDSELTEDSDAGLRNFGSAILTARGMDFGDTRNGEANELVDGFRSYIQGKIRQNKPIDERVLRAYNTITMMWEQNPKPE